jgi:hypothetical protein
MRAWPRFIVAVCLGACAGLCSSVTAVEPLPAWSGDDFEDVKAGKTIPGLWLLTDEVPEEEAPPEATAPIDAAPPTAEELKENEAPSTTIPEQYFTEYFGQRPKSFLVDPQGLLTPQQYRDRLAFLDYHALDSSIDLYIYVFGATQELPGEVRAEELAERIFAEGRPAAFVYYFLGAPQRSVFYLSPSLTDSVSGTDQRRALQSSVAKASEKADPNEQLAGFSTQMAIRLYWMERSLTGESLSAATHAPANQTKHAAEPRASLWSKIPKNWITSAAYLVGVGVAGFLVTMWFRYRARYRFPEFEVERRLGGEHAAGIGGVISFASAAAPPALQREQVPDYLRRT